MTVNDYEGDELCPHGFYSEACGDCQDAVRELARRSLTATTADEPASPLPDAKGQGNAT